MNCGLISQPGTLPNGPLTTRCSILPRPSRNVSDEQMKQSLYLVGLETPGAKDKSRSSWFAVEKRLFLLLRRPTDEQEKQCLFSPNIDSENADIRK